MKVRGHRRTGHHQHTNRDQRPDAEAPGGRAQGGTIRASQHRHDHRRQNELATDEERHGQEMKPQNAVPEAHRGDPATLTRLIKTRYFTARFSDLRGVPRNQGRLFEFRSMRAQSASVWGSLRPEICA